MKLFSPRKWNSFGRISALVVAALACLLTGCASQHHKEAAVSQRGWIGGEFQLAEKPKWFQTKGAVEAFPGELKEKQKTGVLITALSSNTPSRLAGLRTGDLILEINREPVKTLQHFRQTIDHCEPGSELRLKVYRDGQTHEYQVPVGRETFRTGGVFLVALPFILHHPDLWPNPDFSLIAAGYRRDRSRVELGSVEETYRRNCYTNYQPVEGNWRVWLVIMELQTNKKILSQENVPSTLVLAQGAAAK